MRFELLRDLELLRRGWRWGEVRPRWPEPAAIPEPTDLEWSRAEPVRILRRLVQEGLWLPFTRLMTRPQVEGEEWLRNPDRSMILVSNHVSHADTHVLLAALPGRVRERTVIGAAADYWYRRPWLGRLVSFWLNTFPFARSGGARGVLHSSGRLLRSGWHLLIYPEGTRSPDGRLQEFKPGVGHLAGETRAPVLPIHVRGTHRVMPKGRRIPLPAPVQVRVGRPLYPEPGETPRSFTRRVERAVSELGDGSRAPEVAGSWIERWRATAPAPRRPRPGSGWRTAAGAAEGGERPHR
ncbi:MAG TPA: lysophospholipid acyltransferase family protein [Candidatus Dormibacteraeota bacterium]|nr:lysophospholipid acyltransferase family protein [Candidatus Dormibacteraeota bacterium]